MKKIEFFINKKGVRELLLSDEVKKFLGYKAQVLAKKISKDATYSVTGDKIRANQNRANSKVYLPPRRGKTVEVLQKEIEGNL